MDITVISQLIGSIGFPIVMCLILNTQLQKERDSHENEMKELSKTIENNTNAITEMTAIIRERKE